MTGRHRNPPRTLLEAYGCTKEQWLELRDFGLDMVKAGASHDTTPLRAFQHQRHAAIAVRDIEWKLTLPEWWTIWQASGRWSERGRGAGYMMCRYGDKGAYEVGNVFIGDGITNLSEACRKTDLPLGVSPIRKGRRKPFRAYYYVGKKQVHVGVFATADEAHRAYLAAKSSDPALAAPAKDRAA